MEGIHKMYQAKILLNEGYSRKEIARILDVSIRTVYNYEHEIVFGAGKKKRGRPKGKSKLVPFHDYIDSALDLDFNLNAELFMEKLQAREYTVKITILQDNISKKRKVMYNNAVRRFETMLGQQAQVD